ncbi:hypothetical protein BKA66DRAFT_462727 [Pyrenochaeta sp. MPI-SDFR-AT-0127]|nr:hypothetical protein BKA66DRAFT_462727 [Pyrenochaeta sp. MPI-SDFR-AT-0127]
MMTTHSAPPLPTHNILITIPRTASNLVTQLLNLPAQPSIARHSRDGYFFLPALGYRYEHDTFGRPRDEWTEEEQDGIQAALQTSFDAWKTWIADAELEGKGTFIKEHVNWTIKAEPETQYLHRSPEDETSLSLNLTCIPDDFLLNKVRPTFLIRHPALTFPSLFRTARDNEGIDALLTESTAKAIRWEATYRWHITLYKFLVSSPAYPYPSHDLDIQYPIILDASDLANPDLVRKYAAAVGLDPQLVKFEWAAVSDQEQDRLGKVEARMKDTLLKSQGIVLDKLRKGAALNVETEAKKWIEEFGELLGKRLVGLVEEAMGDYEWLFERRVRV